VTGFFFDLARRTKDESDSLAAMVTCSVIVRFEERGSTQEVEVLAESAYEACVLALHKFGKDRFLRGPDRDAVLELTVMSPRRYNIKVADVLDGSTTSRRRRRMCSR